MPPIFDKSKTSGLILTLATFLPCGSPNAAPRQTSYFTRSADPQDYRESERIGFESDLEALVFQEPITSLNSSSHYAHSSKVVDDDILWDALTPAAIGFCSPLETTNAKGVVTGVGVGQPRSVAMDDIDWDLIDFE